MSRLPSLTSRKVIRALKRAGFLEDRQKGSHLILIQPETRAEPWCPFITAGRYLSRRGQEQSSNIVHYGEPNFRCSRQIGSSKLRVSIRQSQAGLEQESTLSAFRISK